MSSDNIAIRVRNLSKKYTIGGPQENYLTLRDAKSQFGEGAVQAIPVGKSKRLNVFNQSFLIIKVHSLL